MIYINSAFKKSLCFIDVEKVQKKLLHVINDSFARRHNANKIRHFKIQTLEKKNI